MSKNIYEKEFNSKNPFWDDDPIVNEFFIRERERFWSMFLDVEEYVFLKDVYSSLGFRATKSSVTVGWSTKKNSKSAIRIEVKERKENGDLVLLFITDGDILNFIDED